MATLLQIQSPWLRGALLAGLIACAAFVFRNSGGQSVDWSFPYFSGAANLAVGGWRVSPAEYAAVRGIEPADYRAHRHERTTDTVEYTFNNYGYVWVVAAARTLFGWMGDGNAVVTLQVVVHIAVALALFAMLWTPLRRCTFFLLYAVNPVVLHIVTYPYYYFWSVLPCALLAVTWLQRERIGAWILPIAVGLAFSYLIRPPVLFVCLLVLVVAFRPGQRAVTLAAAGLFAALLFFGAARTYSSPWHTVYVGIGAYENPYGIDGPLDERGFDYYRDTTGVVIDMNPIDGTFQDAAARERYWGVLRERYLEIAHERPLLLVRNAAYNTAESFALGYDADRSWVTLLSGLAGLVMIGLIVASRAWIWGLGILCYAAAFTPYFPPIPAYLFGAYLLTALAAGHVAERFAPPLMPRQLARFFAPERAESPGG